MSNALKISLAVAGGFVVLLVSAGVALVVFLDVESYRPRLEAAASDALGIEVTLHGEVGLRLFPRPQLTLAKVRLEHQGAEVGTIEEARVGVGLLALLAKRLRIRSLALVRPTLSFEQDQLAGLTAGRPGTAGDTPPGLDSLSVTAGTLRVSNRQSGTHLEADDCSLETGRLRFPQGENADFWRALSFEAEVVCREVRSDLLSAREVELAVNGEHGVIVLEPVTMQIFGARGAGRLRADFSGAVPRLEAHFDLPGFRMEEFFKTLTPQEFARGPLDFSTELSMQGREWREMKRSLTGSVSLRGENLEIHGLDLDQEFARFQASQAFDLVDLGAVFIAGPFGLLVTKGYDFASILQDAGGTSQIRTLKAVWRVDNGTARARDVALATPENRVAVQGEIDLVTGTFNDLTVALIDAAGCAKVRQSIRGDFRNPVVEQPSIFTSLTGPLRDLAEVGRELLPGAECDVFYAGSVAPPK